MELRNTQIGEKSNVLETKSIGFLIQDLGFKSHKKWAWKVDLPLSHQTAADSESVQASSNALMVDDPFTVN